MGSLIGVKINTLLRLQVNSDLLYRSPGTHQWYVITGHLLNNWYGHFSWEDSLNKKLVLSTREWPVLSSSFARVKKTEFLINHSASCYVEIGSFQKGKRSTVVSCTLLPYCSIQYIINLDFRIVTHMSIRYFLLSDQWNSPGLHLHTIYNM